MRVQCCYTCAMLSLDFLHQHPDVVRVGLERRRDPQNIDELLRLIEQRKGLAARCDGLYASLKPLNEAVRGAREKKREELNKQIKAVTKEIRLLSTSAMTRQNLGELFWG